MLTFGVEYNVLTVYIRFLLPIMSVTHVEVGNFKFVVFKKSLRVWFENLSFAINILSMESMLHAFKWWWIYAMYSMWWDVWCWLLWLRHALSEIDLEFVYTTKLNLFPDCKLCLRECSKSWWNFMNVWLYEK